MKTGVGWDWFFLLNLLFSLQIKLIRRWHLAKVR